MIVSQKGWFKLKIENFAGISPSQRIARIVWTKITFYFKHILSTHAFTIQTGSHQIQIIWTDYRWRHLLQERMGGAEMSQNNVWMKWFESCNHMVDGLMIGSTRIMTRVVHDRFALAKTHVFKLIQRYPIFSHW